MGWLESDVALVTGGGSGIGRAVVDRYVAEGARVVVADVDLDRLAEVQEEHGAAVVTIETDVRDISQNAAAVRLAVDTFGKLDILVANAGLGDRFAELADIDPGGIDASFTHVFDVNVKGIILGAKAALPELVKSRGSIVVTLSNSSFWADGGGVIYVASKHAALGVVRQLAHEFAPYVRVNAVAPGATRTNISSPAELGDAAKGPRMPPGFDPNDRVAAIESTTPLRVFARPEDHAASFVLAGSRSQAPAMTGTVIESDGGLGARGLRRVRGGDHLVERLLGEEGPSGKA